MTKTEKRQTVSLLLDELINSTDINFKNIKVTEAISEIRSAGYTSSDMSRVNNILDEFRSDFKLHSNDKSFLMLSRAALIACIEWSLLPG